MLWYNYLYESTILQTNETQHYWKGNCLRSERWRRERVVLIKSLIYARWKETCLRLRLPNWAENVSWYHHLLLSSQFEHGYEPSYANTERKWEWVKFVGNVKFMWDSKRMFHFSKLLFLLLSTFKHQVGWKFSLICLHPICKICKNISLQAKIL